MSRLSRTVKQPSRRSQTYINHPTQQTFENVEVHKVHSPTGPMTHESNAFSFLRPEMNSTSAEPAVSRHITLHLMVAVNFVLSTFNGSKVALKVIVSITATGTGLSWVFRISMGRV